MVKVVFMEDYVFGDDDFVCGWYENLVSLIVVVIW